MSGEDAVHVMIGYGNDFGIIFGRFDMKGRRKRDKRETTIRAQQVWCVGTETLIGGQHSTLVT